MNDFVKNGITINEQKYLVRVHCVICDRPARSHIKGIKGHVGFSSCERCTIKGEMVDHTMIFVSDDLCCERTNESFRCFDDLEHHSERSPLLDIKLQLDMICDFVLDSMHLLDIGAVGMITDGLLNGNPKVKMSSKQIEEADRRILFIREATPSEFQRKLGLLTESGHWKATQNHFFLLYGLPLILKDLIADFHYRHSLLLHVATRILCSRSLAIKYNRSANSYLNTFSNLCSSLYGEKTMTMNIHSLKHLAQDVLNKKCTLVEMSSYPFENYLGTLVGYVKSCNVPIAQISRKLYTESEKEAKVEFKNETKIVRENEVLYNGYRLTNKFPNNWIQLKNNLIIEVIEILSRGTQIDIKGYEWKYKSSIFEYPFNSLKIGMFELHEQPNSDVQIYPLTQVECKVIKIAMNFNVLKKLQNFIIPMLH